MHPGTRKGAWVHIDSFDVILFYHNQSVVWAGDGTGDYEVVEGGDWGYILWANTAGKPLPYCGVFTTVRCLVTTIKAHYGSKF